MTTAFGKWRQEILKIKASLDYTGKCSLKITTNKQIYGQNKLNKYLIL